VELLPVIPEKLGVQPLQQEVIKDLLTGEDEKGLTTQLSQFLQWSATPIFSFEEYIMALATLVGFPATYVQLFNVDRLK
jgi:hypothetical protein